MSDNYDDRRSLLHASCSDLESDVEKNEDSSKQKINLGRPDRGMSAKYVPLRASLDAECSNQNHIELARPRASFQEQDEIRTAEASSLLLQSSDADPDLEAQQLKPSTSNGERGPLRRERRSVLLRTASMAHVRDRVKEVPPEWALLLMGCFLGCATGVSVVAFNKGVHLIHDFAWAGTPHEGAAWLRLQKLSETWHRIMLVPVVGGVIVGVMHTLLAILDQLKACRPHERRRVDLLAASCPVIKATQAAVTLGTGCSLGPEGPSVDIGRACAFGCSELMQNNRERRIALLAAGAAAGISSGFNAPVAGCFFAIETVLRPLHAENSPPLTTAMIILASVLSSTVSNVLLGESAPFTVPTYELRSAAELPLYLMLGMLCGAVSVLFTRLVTWFTSMFDFVKEHLGIPPSITPALGGLGVGIMALRYPGVLYWGFTNIDEILHSGKTALAPGKSLLTQLVFAKVVSTALCKGSGLVGGVYAPSLFIGSALGSVYGSFVGTAVNAAIVGHDAVAHPQAYALVGMAAMLASVCSVPLTSVLLLFELTKDYRILLPLLGAVGLAFWVAAVAKRKKFSGPQIPGVSFTPSDIELQNHIQHRVWRRSEEGDGVELCTIEGFIASDEIAEDELLETLKVSQAMVKDFVKVLPTATVKEAVASMLEVRQPCVLVVDDDDLLEGIMTLTDLHREVVRAASATSHGDPTVLEVESMLVAAICTGKNEFDGEEEGLVVCYPDMTLGMVHQLMQVKCCCQLPVVSRAGKRWQDRGRKVVGLLYKESISNCVRDEAQKRIHELVSQPKDEREDDIFGGH